MRAVLALILSALSAPALAEPPQPVIPKGQEWAPRDFGFSPAARAGDFLFVSGVVAGLDGEATPEAMEASFDRAFVELGEVLAAAGAGWRDVVEMTTYHTDLPAQGRPFIAAKNRRIKAPYPAWTAIDVDRLWPDDGIAEIRLTVYAPRR